MTQDAPPAKRRRLRRLLYAGVALLVVVGIGLFTGLPQHALAEFILSRQLGGSVTIEGLRSWGSIRAERVEIAGHAPDGGTLPAVAVIEGLRADYRWPGLADRLLGEVSAARIQINLDARTGQPSNFAFLTERPDDPAAEGIDARWLPERVDVERLDVTAAINQSTALARGLTLYCGFPGRDSAALEITGDRAEMAFSGLVEGLEETVIAGDVVVTGRVDGDSASLTASAMLEQTGDLNANARAQLSDSWLEPGVELQALDARLDSASLDGQAFDNFVAGLTGGTVGFETLIAEPSHIQFDFAEDTGLPSVHGAVLVQGLRLGPRDQPFYEGDLKVGADIPGGDASEGTMRLSLDEAHVIAADIEGSRESGSATIQGENWEKEKLIALLPSAAHSFVRELDFSHADLWGRVDWSPEAAESEGRVVAADESTPLATFSARLPEQEEWTANGRITVGAGTVDFTYAGRALESFDATATFENLELIDGLRLAAGETADLDVAGTTSGSVTAQARPDWDHITFEADATLSGFAMEPIAFETVTAELRGRLARAADRAELSHMTFDAGDGVTRAGFSDVIINFEPFYVRSEFVAGLDLLRVAEWYDMPDLFGEMEIVGPVGYANESIGLPLTVRFTTLGYRDLVLPYRTTIHTVLTANYDTSSERGVLEAVSMRVGDGTLFVLSQTQFQLDPFRVSRTHFDIKSDLALAVGMGLLASVSGQADMDGQIGIEFGSIVADWNLTSTIDSLVFPEETAAGEGLVIEAFGLYEDAINGSGTVTAERFTIAGGHLTGLSGDMRIADNVISIPDLRGDVFNGRFAGQVTAEPFEPGLPAEVSARLTEFDLARFTEEVKPPETRLTGIANATFSARNTLDGFEDLTVHATSTQNFSLNRDMVRKILESEALSGALGIAQIERTVNRFLGDAPQRPFDSAELTLNDEGDRLRGTAVLLSDKTEDYHGLNLTFELAIDEEALIQTLQMLQENEIANVQF